MAKKAKNSTPTAQTTLACSGCGRRTVECLSTPEWWARVHDWEQRDGKWICKGCQYVERTREQARP
jgi:hypothetical protein